MELKYKYAESTVKPTIVEITAGTVYLRKEIKSVVRPSEFGNKTTYWIYQEATLTPQEFNEYSRLLMAENTIKSVNVSDNIVHIMSSQETVDSQQLALMEAIADLYNAVAAISPQQ